MAKISLNLHELQSEKELIEDFLSQPNAYNNPEFTAKSKRLAELNTLIEKATLIKSLESQLIEAKELADSGDELAEIAKQGIIDIIRNACP